VTLGAAGARGAEPRLVRAGGAATRTHFFTWYPDPKYQFCFPLR
jgi:hypothetical protein